jgi:hypothetical protein
MSKHCNIFTVNCPCDDNFVSVIKKRVKKKVDENHKQRILNVTLTQIWNKFRAKQWQLCEK